MTVKLLTYECVRSLWLHHFRTFVQDTHPLWYAWVFRLELSIQPHIQPNAVVEKDGDQNETNLLCQSIAITSSWNAKEFTLLVQVFGLFLWYQTLL